MHEIGRETDDPVAVELQLPDDELAADRVAAAAVAGEADARRVVVERVAFGAAVGADDERPSPRRGELDGPAIDADRDHVPAADLDLAVAVRILLALSDPVA